MNYNLKQNQLIYNYYINNHEKLLIIDLHHNAFASTNYLNHSYSITEFGTEMSKILKQFKKRTGTGYIYEVNVSFNEFSKILFEYDSDYYRYINNIEEEIIPTFTGAEDNNSYLD